MSNEKMTKNLVGIASVLLGMWLILELRENRVKAITNSFNNRIAVLSEKSQLAQQQAVRQAEINKAETERKKAEAEQRKAEAELALLKAKKENSYECQFWKLQKQQGTSLKADAKIAQYCNIQNNNYNAINTVALKHINGANGVDWEEILKNYSYHSLNELTNQQRKDIGDCEFFLMTAKAEKSHEYDEDIQKSCKSAGRIGY